MVQRLRRQAAVAVSSDDSRESILDDSRRESEEELGDEYRYSSPVVNRSPSLISGSPSAASILRSSSLSSSPNLVRSNTRATSKGVGFAVSGRNWGKGERGGESGWGMGNGERGGASISPKTQKMLRALQDSRHVHTHNCHKVVLRAYLESDARESELADVIGVINLKTRQAEDTPLRGETLLLAQDKLSSNKGRLPGTKAAMRASRSPSSRTFFIHAVDERNAESWMLEVVLQIARSAQSDLVKWYDVCALAARFPRSSISACFPLSICLFVFMYVGAGVVHNVPAGLMFLRVWCTCSCAVRVCCICAS